MLDKPIRDRRAERYAATRAEILEAAWEVASVDGLAGLSLRAVARKVGMQAPSLYSYFDSKNAIYDAMFAQGAREYLQREAERVAPHDPLADLKAGFRVFAEFCTENPVRYQLLFQRTIPGFEPSAASFAISLQGLEVLRARLGRIGFSDPEALDLATALGTGLTDQQISNDPGGDRWTRLIDQAAEMLFTHLSNRSTPMTRRTRP